MAGAPFAAAMRRALVRERAAGRAELGFVAFNGEVNVLQAPTGDAEALTYALPNPPARVWDADLRRARPLARAPARGEDLAGSMVVLSDGDDVGSEHLVDTSSPPRSGSASASSRSDSARAPSTRARCRLIADATGGAYAEARLRRRARRDLRRARAAARQRVPRPLPLRREAGVARDVVESPRRRRQRTAEYVAPTPTRNRPVPPLARLAVRALTGSRPAVGARFAALLACLASAAHPRAEAERRRADRPLLRRGDPTNLVEHQRAARPCRPLHAWLVGAAREDLEIARIGWIARKVVARRCGASLVSSSCSRPFSLVLALLGLLRPRSPRDRSCAGSFARSGRVRRSAADGLQVLASALRAGHSFSGALGVVVENATSRRARSCAGSSQDDQLGVPPEVAIRRMAERMANRDLEQVALLAELQRPRAATRPRCSTRSSRRSASAASSGGSSGHSPLRAAWPGGSSPRSRSRSPCSSGSCTRTSWARSSSSGGQAALLVAGADGRRGLARHPAHRRHRGLGGDCVTLFLLTGLAPDRGLSCALACGRSRCSGAQREQALAQIARTASTPHRRPASARATSEHRRAPRPRRAIGGCAGWAATVSARSAELDAAGLYRTSVATFLGYRGSRDRGRGVGVCSLFGGLDGGTRRRGSWLALDLPRLVRALVRREAPGASRGSSRSTARCPSSSTCS